MQLTLGREIAKIAAGMVWHDQHVPRMGDSNQRNPSIVTFPQHTLKTSAILAVRLCIPFSIH